ncbi:MAG: 4Fe-4S binding protein [Candidatus Omnitrophica bacterium]|nr:4Fe-4S binding protein [Candidatus Omnitrophota bacterium]
MVKVIEEPKNQKRKTGLVTFEGDKVTISLNYGLCTNCGLCISNCPHNVLIWQEKPFKGNNKIDIVQISDLSKCSACGRCQEICKPRAIVIK